MPRPRLRLVPASSAAFTMTELVVGVAVSSLVVTSTLWSMVSVMRTDGRGQHELTRKDEVDRLLDLLQDEARNANQIEVSTPTRPLSAANALFGCSSLPPVMILRGMSSQEDISYAVNTISSTSQEWRGPKVLVRCGPPYGADDTLAATSRVEQVVLDNMPDGGFMPTTSTSESATATDSMVNRSLKLSLSSGSGSRSLNELQIPISSNMAYGLASRSTSLGSCTSLGTTGCRDEMKNSMQFRRNLGDTRVDGSPGSEDIVYFGDTRLEDVRLTGLNGNGRCTSTYCEIRSRSSNTQVTTVHNGDLLVFRDIEIRPQRF